MKLLDMNSEELFLKLHSRLCNQVYEPIIERFGHQIEHTLDGVTLLIGIDSPIKNQLQWQVWNNVYIEVCNKVKNQF